MTAEQIILAWRDASYRESLTDEQRASLPASPVAVVAEPVHLHEGAPSDSYYTGTCHTVCDVITAEFDCLSA